MALQPGFVGKIPSQGDFISRRLPYDFIDCWDNWLQDGVGTARSVLGERWLQTYLVGPVWRFLVGPGACGGHGWLGLWFPSVDRVGRHFPLTVAVPVPARQWQPALLFSQEDWLGRVEDTALRALDPRISLDQLDQALAGLPLELPDAAVVSGGTLPARGVYLLPETATQSALVRYAATLPSAAKAPVSYWHTWGTDTVPACYVVADRLPDAAQFPAYLSGEWAQYGLQPDTLVPPGPEAY
ncbi:type VI secretion system-associated protein TagF [Parasulfuritortus cantonensis]|uniref:Type VI secretion system-associated protein TagF n=1 Tax=Parasulfuritortus cantonensis TaxID=2528202 RepID=A0A4R1BRM9_9PROT|nr:type VI secretion system-associated protein TagF [Parasulfuritortus cantonensis]TCJ20390.1 type VI secretion system-associated protein TagF [Parasulfuritortus cantonensis]